MVSGPNGWVDASAPGAANEGPGRTRGKTQYGGKKRGSNRYIVRPGQALAYKIGQLKFAGLREQARRELGGDFDIRAFHDKLLSEGALPLDLVERMMQSWIEEQKSTP